MIKRVTILGCEFCHAEYTNQEAADNGFMCPACEEGREEKIHRDRISKLESDFRAQKAQLEQEYSDWQGTNTR